jgi:hypothetical protein
MRAEAVQCERIRFCRHTQDNSIAAVEAIECSRVMAAQFLEFQAGMPGVGNEAT